MSTILLLEGSPRRGGNTERLADAFVKGAEGAGHRVTRFSVIDTRVNGCLGCNYCRSHGGECVQKDGMQDIFAAMKEADTIVFASPIYFFALTAQIKAVIDRLYASLGAKASSVTSSALLLAYGGTTEEDAAGALAQYRVMSNYLGWNDLGIIQASGVNEKGEIEGNPALKQAEELGRAVKGQ